MLKIKDNVDLKVLEKYGFRRFERKVLGYNYYEYIINNYDGLYSCNYKIDETREIMLFVEDIPNDDIFLDVSIPNDSIYELDIIFDLIKDGLVEKVEEE